MSAKAEFVGENAACGVICKLGAGEEGFDEETLAGETGGDGIVEFNAFGTTGANEMVSKSIGNLRAARLETPIEKLHFSVALTTRSSFVEASEIWNMSGRLVTIGIALKEVTLSIN